MKITAPQVSSKLRIEEAKYYIRPSALDPDGSVDSYLRQYNTPFLVQDYQGLSHSHFPIQKCGPHTPTGPIPTHIWVTAQQHM